MPVKFVNDLQTRVTTVGGIASTDTEVDITAGDGAKIANAVTFTNGEWCYATFKNASGNLETVKITGVTGDKLTIERAADGDTAQDWAQNDILDFCLNKKALEDLVSEIVGAQIQNSSIEGGTLVGVGGSLDDPTITNGTATGTRLNNPQINSTTPLQATSDELNQLDGVDVGGTDSGDIVTIGDTQTLTNKTLTQPTINNPKINSSEVLGATSEQIDYICKNGWNTYDYARLPNDFQSSADNTWETVLSVTFNVDSLDMFLVSFGAYIMSIFDDIYKAEVKLSTNHGLFDGELQEIVIARFNYGTEGTSVAASAGCIIWRASGYIGPVEFSIKYNSTGKSYGWLLKNKTFISARLLARQQ